MSDVTVAPAGGGAPSAAPSPSPAPAHEVPINQAPTSSPNPVGSQAPDAPPERRSVRDSLKAAYDRASNPPPKPTRPQAADRPEPKPAEARAGHNNPPEETPKSEQPRDRGRFAPRAQGEDSGQAQSGLVNAGQPGQQAQPGQQKRLPPHAPYAEPPQRFSEGGKRDWADTPENIRGDIHRMHQEYGKAFMNYKGAHDAFQPLRQYHDMAVAQGTTLGKVVNNYVTMEQKLRADPLGGLDLIVHNLNLVDPETNKRLDLRDIAYTVLSQSPEQLRMMQQGNQQQAANHQIGALHQKIEGLENTLKQWQHQQQFSYTRSAVDQFAQTHPRIDEEAFGNTVKQELQFGFDLETAYRRAEAFHPATQAAQTRTASAQTRPQDRSISGFPDVAPSNGASRRPKDPSPTAHAALQNAMNRLNGAH